MIKPAPTAKYVVNTPRKFCQYILNYYEYNTICINLLATPCSGRHLLGAPCSLVLSTRNHGSCVAWVSSSKVLGNYVSLHWLPVRARTDFMLATLAFQSQATGQPDYLAVELHPHEPQRCLRLLSQELLTVPSCKTMLGSCHFSVAAPRVWNNLPLDLKTYSNLLHGFKSSLKTYLYRRDYI